MNPKQVFNQDILFDQLSQFSKAHAYDIISKRCQKLEYGLLNIEKMITDPEIDAIRYKAIHSEFDQLLTDIRNTIIKTLNPHE